MKIIEKNNATATLAEYTAEIDNGPLIITSQGRPVAALVSIENADLETVSLATNSRFIELVERSRARVRNEGGIPGAEIRRQFD